jgi:hypothetical protein
VLPLTTGHCRLRAILWLCFTPIASELHDEALPLQAPRRAPIQDARQTCSWIGKKAALTLKRSWQCL